MYVKLKSDLSTRKSKKKQIKDNNRLYVYIVFFVFFTCFQLNNHT